MYPITYPADCLCTGPYCPTDMTDCPNFKLNSGEAVWTGTPFSKNGAYCIYTSNGTVTHIGENSYFHRANTLKIICKE